MKKILLLIGVAALFLCGCNKNDCKEDCIIRWWYPEGESITVDRDGYNKCTDIAKKFNFEARDGDCDSKRLNELIEYNGDTINVYGCFRDGVDYNEMYMFIPGEEGLLKVSLYYLYLYPELDIRTDSTIYYVRGILKLYLHDSNLDFNKDLSNAVTFYPISYNENNK